jgi:hypothetical protein
MAPLTAHSPSVGEAVSFPAIGWEAGSFPYRKRFDAKILSNIGRRMIGSTESRPTRLLQRFNDGR